MMLFTNGVLEEASILDCPATKEGGLSPNLMVVLEAKCQLGCCNAGVRMATSM